MVIMIHICCPPPCKKSSEKTSETQKEVECIEKEQPHSDPNVSCMDQHCSLQLAPAEVLDHNSVVHLILSLP